MRAINVQTTVKAHPEQLFDYVADLARRPAFTDHYLEDYRLAAANSSGKGASASFLIAAPLAGERGEFSIVEAERPRRIVEEGTVGRRGRSRAQAVWEFQPEPGGSTRVELTLQGEPGTRLDAIRQRRSRRWLQRQARKALERLRDLFEHPSQDDPARVTVAGYEQLKSPRFGGHPVRGD